MYNIFNKFIPRVIDLEKAELPVLLKQFSWTQAAPFKEEKHHRMISDSIGNNFTPSAVDLSMRQFQKRLSIPLGIFVIYIDQLYAKKLKVLGQNDSNNYDESPPMSPKLRIDSIRKETYIKNPNPTEDYSLDPVDLESHTVSKQVTAEQRYWYYIERGVNCECLSKMSNETIKQIQSKISDKFLNTEQLQKSLSELQKEVKQNHIKAIKQSIVDYILIDPNEQIRLKIPKMNNLIWAPATARAPVPWHDSMIQSKKFIDENLFITNHVMCEILKIFSLFEKCRVVDMSVFTPNILPISINEFQAVLRNQCTNFKNKMLNEWVPKVASMFLEYKNTWYNIVTACEDPDKGYFKLGQSYIT
jgi:dynein heavy chain